jgi:LysR family transcriptional regulator, glycine cleavage system transcriptional activator
VPKVPLHVLPGFVAAARARNLSRAAATLHVTVSALSHQMRGLEELLGYRLFHRGPRGLTLTPAGERLFGQVAPHLDAISAALAPQPARNPDALTVSVMPSVASSWLIPRLPDFTARHPEVELNLESTSDVVDFDRQEVDVAIRFGQGDWPQLRTHLLFDEWVIPVCSPGLLRRFPQSARGDFTGVPLLRDLGERWHAWFAQFGGEPPSRWVAAFDDTDALQRAAMEGMGVALGRLTMARPLLESGRLVALTGNRLPDRYAHYLVYPPRSEHHSALIAFRQWILDVAGSERADRPAARPAARAPRPRPPRRGRRR